MSYPFFKSKKLLYRFIQLLCFTAISGVIYSSIFYKIEARKTPDYPINVNVSSYLLISQNTQTTKIIPTKSASWLERSFEQYSIVWLFISSIVGGLIGASVKLAFEVILPAQLKERRDVILLTHKYTTPILLAAEALRNRLSNMIKLIDLVEKYQWLSRNNVPNFGQAPYYYISTMYLVGRFFGWVEILRSTVVYLDLSSVQETRRFERYIELIESCFSNPEILPGISDIELHTDADRHWCYSYELSAIGEMMMIRDTHDNNLKTIGFSVFKKQLLNPNDSEFRECFECLSRLFEDLKKTDNNCETTRFKRIVVAHAILNAFIEYIDPAHIRTEKQKTYTGVLNSIERDSIENKLKQLKK